MTNYLRPDLFKKSGIQNFDDWAADFGEVITQLELKPAGDGFRAKKRFAKFTNLPELMSMYKEFADIQTAEDLNLPVPKVNGGKPHVVVAKPTEFQKAYMKKLAERSEAVHGGHIDPHLDNMLKITHEARHLGLDQRTIDPTLENDPRSKINLCVDNIMSIYEKTAEQKGVQAVFCDIAVNEENGKFSIYEALKDELIKRGMPENEICFAGDAKNIKQRNNMYSELRNGDKRVVIASTSKMGTGANIQTRLCALHHLDIPWKPSDLEQRNGRIVRQFNNFPEVDIFNYVTEGTFDAYMLNIITTKQKFISQLMSSKTTARTCDDADELVLTYSEMQALATGDPRIKERIELGNKIAELRTVEAAHYANIYKMQDEVINLPPKIAGLKNVAEQAKEDKETAVREKQEDFTINIGGKLFERADAENVILKEVLKAEVECAKNNGAFEKKLGEYNGFEFGINSYRVLGVIVCELFIKGNLTYKNEASTTEGGRNTTRLEHLVSKGIDKKIEETVNKIKSLTLDFEVAERNANTPFERADELKKMVDRMTVLDEIFSKKESVIIDEDEEEEETEISVKNEIDKKDIDNDETPTQKLSQNNTQNKHRR